MNRAVMLRFAACGIIGFGAALLIAALLLSTYTGSRITKVPLDIDTTLVSTGTGALTTIFAVLIFVVAIYMLWKSWAAL